MANIKLLRLLSSLDKTELKALTKFIDSEYFKVSKACIRLYKGLQKYAPHFEETQIDKAKLWKKVYPKSESAYSLKRLTNKMSDLSIEVERFLVIQTIQTDEQNYLYRKLKGQAFNQHNLYDDFKKEIQFLIKAKEGIEEKSLIQYRELADLYHTFYFHAKNNKVVIKNLSIEQIWKNQQAFSFLANLTYSIELICRKFIYEEVEEVDFLPVIQFQSNYYRENAPLIHQLFIQLHLLLIAKEHNPSQYDKVEQLIVQNLTKLDPDNKTILLIALSNYLTKRIYEGQSHYKERFFRVYKIIYEQGIFTKYGHLAENTFLNMISFGLKYGDINWVEQFIIEATPKLEQTIKKQVAQLGWVYFYFETKQYDEAIENLIIQKGGNPFFKMRMWSLSVRIYYEIAKTNRTYFSTFFSACDKFDYFLKKDEMLTRNKKVGYINFISIMRKLAKYKQEKVYLGSKRQSLLEKLIGEKQIALKEWVKEKIEE